MIWRFLQMQLLRRYTYMMWYTDGTTILCISGDTYRNCFTATMDCEELLRDYIYDADIHVQEVDKL